ncbi:MAG: AAA family ATPase [Bryobacteraceae bacterium]
MMNTRPEDRFTWLQLSDLKVGASSFDADDFLRDLEHAYRQTGPWNAVIFAGDTVDGGIAGELSSGIVQAAGLFEQLMRFAHGAYFLAVPGNHDLARVKSPAALLLRQWPQDEEVRELVWAKDSELLNVARESFGAFETYLGELMRRFGGSSLHWGEIPGEWMASIPVGGRKIGIVGLNSALSQVGQSQTQKAQGPALEARQLASACGADPESWSQEHDLRVLVTHYGPSQMNRGNLSSVLGNRFQLHVCGNLHGGVRTPIQEPHGLVLETPPLRTRRMDTQKGYAIACVDLAEQSLQWRVRARDRSTGWDEVLQAKVSIPGRAPASDGKSGFRIESIELTNFRCFSKFHASFRQPSTLPGEWTCLAGINGAGKSGVLQALCVAMLGEPLARELGGERLQRMRRRENGMAHDASIRLIVNDGAGSAVADLKMTIGEDGRIDVADAERWLPFWKQLNSTAVMAYGATRNLSPFRDSRYEGMSPDVRRLMTMFDPLSQLASAEVLLTQQPSGSPVVRLFAELVEQVFAGELTAAIASDGGLRFAAPGRNGVEAVDLPDGFRSSAAWMADFCAVWCEKNKEKATGASLADMDGIVLIDEIDLHLHPSLQRQLVPKLRKALPHVQWIVTTHSPLVLGNFDSAEVIALDREAEGGVRQLDRQILGFSSDQIYNWLMGTPPTGAEIEEQLEASEKGTGLGNDEIARLLEMSPKVTAEEARRRVSKLTGSLSRLKP